MKKARKPFHPATGIVRRFLAPLALGFVRRNKVRQSAWYNAAARGLRRAGRPPSPQSTA